MTYQDLYNNIQQKHSFLCVGLDTDINKIPIHLRSSNDPVFEFNKQIIDITQDLCIAYKLNLAFYETMGHHGLISLEKTIKYIPDDIFLIADAKRGDIGNTSRMYATAFFEHYDFDSITVSPYMGEDSVTPFLSFKDKWVILLALTSNIGSKNFQMLNFNGNYLYEEVLKESKKWAGPDQLMYVVGATQAERLKSIREIVPDNFLLIPGVGAQGGDLEAVTQYGINKSVGLMVNASRSIIYASQDIDFAKSARIQASQIQSDMKRLLEKYS
jgi:orotidine-5'-phosphate decarboxylase